MEERLKLFLAMEGLSPSQFADKLGVQRSGVSHLLSGRNKPSFEFISKMLTAWPKLNPDWLIMGTGKAYRDMPGAEVAPQACNDETIVSEVPLQAEPATDVEPSLFTDINQPAAPAPTQPSAPAPAATAPAAKPKPMAPIPVPKPSGGKQIAQITIFYTDGTYEIR